MALLWDRRCRLEDQDISLLGREVLASANSGATPGSDANCLTFRILVLNLELECFTNVQDAATAFTRSMNWSRRFRSYEAMEARGTGVQLICAHLFSKMTILAFVSVSAYLGCEFFSFQSAYRFSVTQPSFSTARIQI